jgi:hypothetical protein
MPGNVTAYLTLFVVNRDNFGHYNSSSNSQIVQSFTLGSNGIYSASLFSQNTLYAAASSALLSAFSFSSATDQFQTPPSSACSLSFGFPGTTTALSAAGTNNAILWAIERPSSTAAALHAYDPTNLHIELWNNSQAANNRDKAGSGKVHSSDHRKREGVYRYADGGQCLRPTSKLKHQERPSDRRNHPRTR